MDRLRMLTEWFDAPAPLPFPGAETAENRTGAWSRRDAGRSAGGARAPGRGAERVRDAAAMADALIGRAQSSIDELNELVGEEERAMAPLPFRRFVVELDPDDGPRAA